MKQQNPETEDAPTSPHLAHGIEARRPEPALVPRKKREPESNRRLHALIFREEKPWANGMKTRIHLKPFSDKYTLGIQRKHQV